MRRVAVAGSSSSRHYPQPPLARLALLHHVLFAVWSCMQHALQAAPKLPTPPPATQLTPPLINLSAEQNPSQLHPCLNPQEPLSIAPLPQPTGTPLNCTPASTHRNPSQLHPCLNPQETLSIAPLPQPTGPFATLVRRRGFQGGA